MCASCKDLTRILALDIWQAVCNWEELGGNRGRCSPLSLFLSPRQEGPLGDGASENSESEPEDFVEEASTEGLYSTSPPSTPRQMKRQSTKHQRNNGGRPTSRANLKGESGQAQGYPAGPLQLSPLSLS